MFTVFGVWMSVSMPIATTTIRIAAMTGLGRASLVATTTRLGTLVCPVPFFTTVVARVVLLIARWPTGITVGKKSVGMVPSSVSTRGSVGIWILARWPPFIAVEQCSVFIGSELADVSHGKLCLSHVRFGVVVAHVSHNS